MVYWQLLALFISETARNKQNAKTFLISTDTYGYACKQGDLVIAMRGQAARCTQLSRCGWVEPREAQNAFPTDKKRITDSFECQPPGD